MILGKLIRYLRTLKSKFASPLSQKENTMQWILMKSVLSYHYKLLHLLIAIEQIHGPLDLYLDFIFYRKKLSNRNKVMFGVDEFSFSTRFFKYCIIEFIFTTQITRLNEIINSTLSNIYTLSIST